MKFVVAATSLAFWATSSVTTAFAPPSVLSITRNARGSITTNSASSTRGALIVRYAGPEEEEENAGLDLDLSEMFELFDAADKGEDFDKAIGKVKAEEK